MVTGAVVWHGAWYLRWLLWYGDILYSQRNLYNTDYSEGGCRYVQMCPLSPQAIGPKERST
eukprot:1548409-Amphidinium_carterae.1